MSLVRFPLEDLLGDGIVRESEYRQRLLAHNLDPYRNRPVMIPWIHKQELPLWVYLMAAAHLSPVVSVLSFGEQCSPIVLIQNGRHSDAVTGVS